MNISFSNPTLQTSVYSGLKISYGKEQSRNNASKQDSLVISKEARDKQSISGQFKKSNVIEGFMKQKAGLMENKQKLIENTLKNGDDLSSIKTQLADFDAQIRLVDDQINQQLLDERQKALGLDEEDKKDKPVSNDEPKTEQELQGEVLNNLVDVSGNMEQTKKLAALKNKMQGEANVMKQEIALDGARGLTTTAKRERLSDLTSKIDQLDNRVGEMLGTINEKIDSSTENRVTTEDTQEEFKGSQEFKSATAEYVTAKKLGEFEEGQVNITA